MCGWDTLFGRGHLLWVPKTYIIIQWWSRKRLLWHNMVWIFLCFVSHQLPEGWEPLIIGISIYVEHLSLNHVRSKTENSSSVFLENKPLGTRYFVRKVLCSKCLKLSSTGATISSNTNLEQSVTLQLVRMGIWSNDRKHLWNKKLNSNWFHSNCNVRHFNFLIIYSAIGRISWNLRTNEFSRSNHVICKWYWSKVRGCQCQWRPLSHVATTFPFRLRFLHCGAFLKCKAFPKMSDSRNSLRHIHCS